MASPRCLTAAAVALASILSSPALALTDGELWDKIVKANPEKSERARLRIFVCHKTDPVCQTLDTDFRGLSADKLGAYIRKTADLIDTQAADYENGSRKIDKTLPPPKTPNKTPNGKPDESKPMTQTSAYVLVRRTLEDISTITQPKAPADVTGAQFAYNRDNVATNTSWSARGVVAVPFYSSDIFDPKGDRYAISTSTAFAPFVAFDKVTNSSAALAKSNLNNLNFGLISEYAVRNVGRDRPTDHYFRLNTGTNMDFEGHLKSWYARGEWEPFSTANWLNAPIAPLSGMTGFNISPLVKLRAEYIAQAGDIPQPVFATHNEAFRVGPRVGVQIQPVLGLWPTWINSFTLVATYGYLYDTISGRSYGLFDSALNYNIDKDGNYAVSASYRKGRLEETGASVDQIMFGLAVKLNEQLFSTP